MTGTGTEPGGAGQDGGGGGGACVREGRAARGTWCWCVVRSGRHLPRIRDVDSHGSAARQQILIVIPSAPALPLALQEESISQSSSDRDIQPDSTG